MPEVLHCQLLSAFGLHASRQLADGRGVSSCYMLVLMGYPAESVMSSSYAEAGDFGRRRERRWQRGGAVGRSRCPDRCWALVPI
jgi:hypothetical protein